MGASDQQVSDATCDVAIIGAGPSGLAAAAVLREHGVGVTVIDEQPRAGGQILRQPPKNFSVAHWLPAKLYYRVKAALHAVSERQDIDWRFQSTVLGILRPSAYRTLRADASGAAGPESAAVRSHMERQTSVAGPDQKLGGDAHELWIQGPSGCYLLRANAVLLAPGCYERPLAFPGWTLPGVMGAGAIQGFVKSQQFVPGNRFVLAGSHPLQLVVADQLLTAGAQVAAVVFTQRKQQALRMLRHPFVALRHHRQLLETSHILRRLRRAGVPVIFGHTIVRADGAHAVEKATIAEINPSGTIDHHKTHVFECDRIGVCHGFLASSELARQTGADMHWKDHAGGWLARHDDWLESSIRNLFVAGEITSVDGADAALEKGRIAAVGILRSLGRLDDNRARSLASNARKRLSHLQRFAAVLQQLAQPPAGLALQTMSDDTLLCRCESIQRGELQRALADNKHVLSADAAKLLTRVGMGLCQGRLCGDNVARVIADARGVQPDEVGPFQAQAPVKPVPLAALTRGRCS
ncbi:pyridine nucleotide-disulfide oxidoreductase [Steroidobacter agaridevorans]|uniref:Pyridine nucleotide-disulfide oxidoreductase n=1 Tax=Steroidobacter agaridevorans TaxID=2695856 RepID=A0A829YEG4_9GAMM|nr:pyridine nucleotide-disulfide oxidoreductase [Steroidobacter agaridevorans]